MGGGQKQLAWHPISPRHASEGGDTRCSLSQGGKRKLLEMSLHEYIDIPLEGSLFTVRLHSVLHCFFGGLSLSCTLSFRHPPLLATRLFKEWLEASAGVRMNAREDRVPRETRKGRKERRLAGSCRPPRRRFRQETVFDPGMQAASSGWSFASHPAGIGAD